MQWTLYIPLLVGFPLSCRAKLNTPPTISTALQEAANVLWYTGMASTHNRGVFICQSELGGPDNRVCIQTVDKANALKANSPPFYKTQIEARTTLHQFPINVAVLMLLYEKQISQTFIYIRYRKFVQVNEPLHFWLNSLDAPLATSLANTYL